jgi:hypothetical protein
LKNLVVIFRHTPRKCVRVFRPYNGYLATKSNHDSWGTCTTSVECKTVITVMLTIISGMDPHMISGNLGWVLVKASVPSSHIGV